MKAKINPNLASLVVPTKGLHLDPKNARKHNPRNLGRIKRSLRAFGQQKAIVTAPCKCHEMKGAHEVVVAGNGTLFCAQALGWKEIARSLFDDPKRARAYAIADNRSAEGAGWHKAILDETLRELDADEAFDLADIGFEADLEMPEPASGNGKAATFSVVVDFDNEDEQGALLEELEGRGMKVRLIMS
jgi:ParB-like chromosome segregation protein Spo0J